VKRRHKMRKRGESSYFDCYNPRCEVFVLDLRKRKRMTHEVVAKAGYPKCPTNLGLRRCGACSRGDHADCSGWCFCNLGPCDRPKPAPTEKLGKERG
jgi:hypothetical protein